MTRFRAFSGLRNDERRGRHDDFRGWEVRSEGGGSLGCVRDVLLLEDRASHLDVLAGPIFAPRRVLVPIASVTVDDVRETIVVSHSMEELLPHLPEYDGDLGTLERELEPPAAEPLGAAARIERAEEELRIDTHPTRAGEVVVHKTVEVEHAKVPTTRMREDVHTERRPAADERAQRGLPYQVGDELHVPIVEEEIVVQTRRVVREVLVVRKREVRETVEVEADLRKERVRVERVEPGGEVGGHTA